jgi:dTDP-4-amino-4,6-dideoxygalactose transaminase
MEKIPFNKPSLAGREREYLAQALQNMHISGDGPFSKQCHAFLERELGVAKALLTTSCTDALEMCALLLDIEPGDEVIVPAFTFVSTVNAFVLRGARPRFVDVRPDTLNLDERQLEAACSDRTRAIVAVHYAGIGCELDDIVAIARERRVALVEDNAHGLFGAYKGKPLGTFGSLATQSFHETKNFSCGEGGALLVNDARFIERAEILREKGTNRSRFFRGQVDKYTWVDVGSSFLLSDLLAAFLWAQLEQHSHIQATRQRIWERYAGELRAWAARREIQLPHVPAHCTQSYHLFYLIMPTEQLRDDLMAHLARCGVSSVFHYLPLHLAEMGRRFGGKEGDCPVTESVAGRLLRLPLFNEMSEVQQERVIDALHGWNP